MSTGLQFRFGMAVLALASIATAKDVFRYVDEETGQSHYMTGEPGMSVEGGWTFTNADGTFELVYKADEEGFQPEAAHIPIPVEDTNEVSEAKANFYRLFEEAKEAQEPMMEDARKRREAEPYGFFRPT